MKGRMKKAFAVFLAAAILVGGMPVNMQADVITEEKTESASEKVNEKYADTEELDLMDRERQETQAGEQEKRENTEQAETEATGQPDTDTEQEETAQTEIEEETEEETEEPAETEEETEKQEEAVQTETEEQSETEEQQAETEQPDTELTEIEEETEGQEENSISGTVKSTKDFYYTQEFPEGLKVTLSADKGIVPDDAKVNMELVENERLDHLKAEIKEQMEVLAEEKAQEDERSIFNMYSDLQVSVEDTYALDIKITYTDEAGNICIYEPKKDQSIQVKLEQTVFSGIAGDEMSEVNLFYTSDISENEYRSASAQGAEENTGIELLDDNLDVEGESICFQAEHFSMYVVSVVKYAGNASAEKIAAEQKAWNLINKYADPDYYLNNYEGARYPSIQSDRYSMTDSQYEELRQAALKTVNECTTQYEKIKAITAFVADRTYYDYMYTSGKSNELFIYPYDVFSKKRTICDGYARLMRAMLISIGIPCIYITGNDHAYNAVYDSDNRKWIFADATWCSSNSYTNEGKWVYKGYSYRFFDLAPEQIAELSHHEVYGVNWLLKDGLYYNLVTPQDEKTWCNGEWYFEISGVKNKNITEAKIEAFENLDVKGILDCAFSYCDLLQKIDLLQTGITEIEGDAFSGCSMLKEIKLPSTLKKLDRYAFAGCTSLNEIKLPNTLIKLGQCVFYGCTSLKKIDLSQTGITEIYPQTFMNSVLEEIELPSSLTNIGQQAFSDCTMLKKMDLSQTRITEIPTSTFYGCTALKEVKLPNTVTKIEKSAFMRCSSREKIDLSQTNVKEIQKNAFYDCEKLGELGLPKSLTKIEDNAFYFCKSLKKIDLSQTNLEQIGEYAFCNCSSLKKIDLSQTNVKEIGEGAFCNCSVAEEMDLSQTRITEIPTSTFYGCEKLGELGLPKSLTKIEDTAFYLCRSLKKIDLSQTNVKEIGEGAFCDCSVAEELDLPKILVQIGEYAFSGCDSIKKVKLPATLKTIGKHAFACKNLKYVITDLSRNEINADAFGWYDQIIVCPYIYQIKFDGNGADEGNMDIRLCAPNEEQCLDNSYQKKGYTFADWNTQADGKGKFYEENAYVKNLTKKADGVVTLYAQWNAVKYQIKYNLDGGKNNKKNPKTYKITSKTIKLLNPSKKGYVFKGWYRDKKFKKKVTAIEKGSRGNITLYAKWAKEKYTITYKLHGGKNNKKNPKTYTITSKTIKLSKPSRKGYVFKGWYRDKKYRKKITAIKKGSTGKITLYAKWKKK